MYTNSRLLQAVINGCGNGKFYRLPPDEENPGLLADVFNAASQNSFNASSHNSDAKLTAIYAAQPALLVFALESTSLPLMPKSQSFTQPPRSSKMLEGFTSRKVGKQYYNYSNRSSNGLCQRSYCEYIK